MKIETKYDIGDQFWSCYVGEDVNNIKTISIKGCYVVKSVRLTEKSLIRYTLSKPGGGNTDFLEEDITERLKGKSFTRTLIEAFTFAAEEAQKTNWK